MKKFLMAALLFAAASLCSFAQDSPDFRVASVFSDHMVFQRDTLAPVWGWAEPGAKVTVRSTLPPLTPRAVGRSMCRPLRPEDHIR